MRRSPSPPLAPDRRPGLGGPAVALGDSTHCVVLYPRLAGGMWQSFARSPRYRWPGLWHHTVCSSGRPGVQRLIALLLEAVVFAFVDYGLRNAAMAYHFAVSGFWMLTLFRSLLCVLLEVPWLILELSSGATKASPPPRLGWAIGLLALTVAMLLPAAYVRDTAMKQQAQVMQSLGEGAVAKNARAVIAAGCDWRRRRRPRGKRQMATSNYSQFGAAHRFAPRARRRPLPEDASLPQHALELCRGEDS